jgi:predicted small lipoprotein YifL
MCCVVAALILAGCGQTGALYFDEAPPADQLPPSKKAPSVSVAPDPVPAEKNGKPE